jgi:hypothetical protein
MSNSNINYTTFICYRRKEYGDTERPIGSYVARIIYEYLSKKEISVCYDVESFPLGRNYQEKTIEYLDQVRCFILILTPDLLSRCLNKDNDDVYLEVMHAISRYHKEKEDSSIPYQNKFLFLPINPDSLFFYDKHVPSNIDPRIKEILKNNMADVNFSKYAFHHDIERELVSPIINVLSANTIDEINYRPRENKQDIVAKYLPIQNNFIGRIIAKFLNRKK